MPRLHPECPDSDDLNGWIAADVLLRQEPDKNEDEEDPKTTAKNEDDDDDDEDDGYSE